MEAALHDLMPATAWLQQKQSTSSLRLAPQRSSPEPLTGILPHARLSVDAGQAISMPRACPERGGAPAGC